MNRRSLSCQVSPFNRGAEAYEYILIGVVGRYKTLVDTYSSRIPKAIVFSRNARRLSETGEGKTKQQRRDLQQFHVLQSMVSEPVMSRGFIPSLFAARNS